jgi:hypothetical protein
MAAPERFAEMADSSCNAGVVHTWHDAEVFGTAAIPSGIGGSTDMRHRCLRGPYLTHRRLRLPERLAMQHRLHRHMSTALPVFSVQPQRRSTMLSDRNGNALTASSVDARRLRRRSRPTPLAERRDQFSESSSLLPGAYVLHLSQCLRCSQVCESSPRSAFASRRSAASKSSVK